jgi:hypothetical protein
VCFFSGLGFIPIWEVCLASYKHAYHEWCALYFFRFPTKCVQQGCGEEMHDSWWNSEGLKKPTPLIHIGQGGSNLPKAQQP